MLVPQKFQLQYAAGGLILEGGYDSSQVLKKGHGRTRLGSVVNLIHNKTKTPLGTKTKSLTFKIRDSLTLVPSNSPVEVLLNIRLD